MKKCKYCEHCGIAYSPPKLNSKHCSIFCKKRANQFLVKCAWCEKEKIVYKSSFILNKNHFCDNKCQWEWRRKTGEMFGENHPGKKKWVEVICKTCSRFFSISPKKYKFNKYKNFYCNKKCKDEAQKKICGELHPNYSKVDVKCSNCENKFKKKKSSLLYSNNHFCNKECQTEFLRKPENTKQVEVFCEECGDSKFVNEARYRNNKSKKFYCQEHRGCNHSGENNYNWQGVAIISCDYCNKEFERKQSLINARPDSRRFCSDECRYSFHSESFTGENHPNWKGGPNSLILTIRSSPQFDRMRKLCFERDSFSSCLSGKKTKKSNGLHHHHLNSLSYLVKDNNITFENYLEFEDILFDINNVVTLLDHEHMKFHSVYGYSSTREQYEEFANSARR